MVDYFAWSIKYPLMTLPRLHELCGNSPLLWHLNRLASVDRYNQMLYRRLQETCKGAELKGHRGPLAIEEKPMTGWPEGTHRWRDKSALWIAEEAERVSGEVEKVIYSLETNCCGEWLAW